MDSTDLIIGLGHKKRVGKDTFAEMLQISLEELGYDVYKISFVHLMKEMAAELFGVYGLRSAYHYEVNPNHKDRLLDGIVRTPRQIWIEFGNSMRDIYPDIWVDKLMEHIQSVQTHNRLNRRGPIAIVITDVRYPNEAAAVKTEGGTLIRIDRPDIPRSDDVADCALDGFDGWDYGVVNDGTLEKLEAAGDHVARILHHSKGCHGK